MTNPLYRIATVSRTGPTSLDVTWKDGPSDCIDLTGWIARGDVLLAPLKDETVFATIRIGDYGASIEWGEEGGDLAIDAYHLRQIANEQRRFGHEEAATWQAVAGLSNQEAADFLGISLSTWNAYKAGTNPVPVSVAMSCRAALRDPLMLHAHYRPRKPGRPRRVDKANVA